MKLWFIVNDLKMGNKQKNGSFQVPEKSLQKKFYNNLKVIISNG